jgi:hypothetical protein
MAKIELLTDIDPVTLEVSEANDGERITYGVLARDWANENWYYPGIRIVQRLFRERFPEGIVIDGQRVGGETYTGGLSGLMARPEDVLRVALKERFEQAKKGGSTIVLGPAVTRDYKNPNVTLLEDDYQMWMMLRPVKPKGEPLFNTVTIRRVNNGELLMGVYTNEGQFLGPKPLGLGAETVYQRRGL